MSWQRNERKEEHKLKAGIAQTVSMSLRNKPENEKRSRYKKEKGRIEIQPRVKSNIL